MMPSFPFPATVGGSFLVGAENIRSAANGRRAGQNFRPDPNPFVNDGYA